MVPYIPAQGIVLVPILRFASRWMIMANAVLVHDVVCPQNAGECTADHGIIEDFLEHGDFGQ